MPSRQSEYDQDEVSSPHSDKRYPEGAALAMPNGPVGATKREPMSATTTTTLHGRRTRKSNLGYIIFGVK